MDEEISIVYHFGGQWVNGGGEGMKYVGGEKYKIQGGYELDRFCYWDVHNFYKKTLKMENFRLWFRRGGDAGLVEMLDDDQIIDMIQTQVNFPSTDVFAVENGENVTSVEELVRRLEGEKVNATEIPNDTQEDVWSDDNEDVDYVPPTDGNVGESSDDEYSEEFDSVDEEGDEGDDEDVGERPLSEAPPSESPPSEAPPSEAPLSEVHDGYLSGGSDDQFILGDHELYDVNRDSDGDIVRDYYPWFNEEKMEDGKLYICNGMKFMSLGVIRKALKEWCISKGIDLVFLKNNSKVLRVHCKNECGFLIHASKINEEGCFQIKTWYPDHSCPWRWKNHLVTSKFIAENFLEDIRDNPSWPVIAMQKAVQKKLKAKTSLQQYYRAKQKALKIINGDAKKQYYRLRDYADVIFSSNEGSRVKITTRMGPEGYVKEIAPSGMPPTLRPLPEVPQFLYCYIRFAAQRRAFFSGLRTFVGLDGCFLKGVMGGQLLSAVAKDGNENMYPLAIAVVDAEDKASWGWFLQNLIDDFGHPNETKMVFMSDKQKGLQEAMNRLMPGVEHRICVKQLYENFRGTYKGQQYKELLWQAATTGSMTRWSNCLEKMKKLPMGDEAVNFLMKNDPRTWSRSHFSPHCKTNLIVNNISESFNAAILHCRDKPILSMLEWIRRKLMKRIYEKKAAMMKYEGSLCPTIVKTLNRNKAGAGNCFAIPSGDMKFEVDCGASANVVDINAKTCTCRMWELSGIPCKHAIAAICESRLQPEHFVDECYSRTTYLAVYSHHIVPLPSQEEWPMTDNPDIYPPFIRKPTGRPKRKRRRAADEPQNQPKLSRVGGQVKCGNCNQFGHNVRGCSAAKTGETPWQRRRRIEQAQRPQPTTNFKLSTCSGKKSTKKMGKKRGKKVGDGLTLGSQQSQLLQQ